MDSWKDEQGKKNNWIFFLRQFVACSYVILGDFTSGLYLGSMTVVIPQIRKEANSTDVVSPQMASWLYSAPAYGGLPWGIIIPTIAYRFGRKIPLIMISLNTLICNIIFYLSSTVVELIICQTMAGMLECSDNTITIMVLTEYTSPKYRGVFMTLKSASFYWGIWVSNAIGTFFHWKNIGLVVFALNVYNLSVLFVPESPYWLATKGRFQECSSYHRWLKGNSKESEEELKELIITHREYLKTMSEQPVGVKDRLTDKICKIVGSKNFYKPMFYSLLAGGLYHFSGKLTYSIYAIDIIKKITASETAAYKGMLILDGVTVCGMYLGCSLTKILKRRTQLLSLSSVGVGFLFVLSIYLYMIKLNMILENRYIPLILLSGFSISISCGPMATATCCYGELAPLKCRSLYLCVFNFLVSIVTGSTLKIAPIIFQNFDTHGAFFFYSITSSVFIYLLYKYLPETKGKTIQEIERCVAGKDPIVNNETETVPLKQNE